MRGRGEMWLNPAAENDPKAISMQIEGFDVAGMEIIKRYLPDGVTLPDIVDCGNVNLRATMRGSHASPNIQVLWEAPSVHAEGSAHLSRSAWKATANAPTFDLAGTLYTQFPDFQLSKTIYTQVCVNFKFKII